MANQKISALTEATTAAAADELAIVQSGTTKRIGVDTFFSTSNAVWQGWTFLTSPLTSASFDGDAYSTTAKTLIDLSAVFSVPADVKAVLAVASCNDSGSAATSGLFVILSPNATANSGTVAIRPSGYPDDEVVTASGIVPCDANGDIYYQIAASGAGTLDLWIELWGYLS
jgi:hypothetical protein